ncbi:MAG TPA: ABC transporter permease, partial [Gemmatimonadaceae bacterium]|nr:ABC transporter permease [Gemmatimonadaceae bacterium]
MDTLSKDLAYAARVLRKSPAFAFAAIFTLALGIGASTAIFSVVDTVLLRPLPYADPSRLVLVWGDMRNRNVRDFPFPPGDFKDLSEQTKVFSDVAAVVTFRAPITGDGAEPEQVKSAAVTTNFFTALGGKLALGRNFQESDGV